MQITDPNEGRSCVSVPEYIQRRIPNTKRILRRLLPVRVLVLQRRKYLVQMVIIRVSHVCPQNSVTSRFIKPELKILCVQVQIRFGASQTKQQIAIRKVGHLKTGRCRHRGGAGRRCYPARLQQNRAVDKGRKTCAEIYKIIIL